jgi:hypothetical protein
MKQFLAVYLGSSSPVQMEEWEALDEKTRQSRESAGMQAWMNWGIKNSKFIISTGAPLGKTKRVNREGVSDTENLMAAFTLVQAESHEEAARLFIGHPHFTIFPGESVEIMECLPLPEMK